MHSLGKKEIFRFILTHLDIDHMDGFKRLFDEFNVMNFWDTENNKKIENFQECAYKKDDWTEYQKQRRKALYPIMGLEICTSTVTIMAEMGTIFKFFVPQKN